ncbi:acetolactate synthase large subunit, partial [Saccharothrix sp. MB29]|nr:acetolactate synthase large subunit [Saccharothrix sp. MB29]
GDCKEIIAELIDAVRAEKENAAREVDLAPWWATLDEVRGTFPLGYDWPEDGTLSPQYVIERIGVLTPADTVFTAGVGQHQMWAAQ